MGKGVLRHALGGAASSSSSSSSATVVPQAPVFYPTEEEFADPLAFIFKIRPLAEPFGICRIVPPRSWNPPFALDRAAFTFPTKSQAIHRLQARPPSCDPATFRLEYGRFLESHLGKRSLARRVVFEGDDLDLCRLFNAVKRYGGYDKVCAEKRWADVARFVRPAIKISECAKHVLCQLYREHLYDYEEYNSRLDRGTKKGKSTRRCPERNTSAQTEIPNRKRRRKGLGCERAKEVVEEVLDQICGQCKSGLHGEVMLLCDRCDKGWHLYCLSPPLEKIPSGNWYCLECVNSDMDSFGFVPGKLYSVNAFKRMDDRMRRKWFGQTNASRVQIEKRFWEIVEGRSGEVEVMYGSDLDTSLYGSGFPRANDPIPSLIDPNVWRQYASSPWNLNNLPKLPGGEPKCWYGVPGTEANAFEQVMRKTLPDLFEVQPDLLFQLVTMLNPFILLEKGVPVYSVLQSDCDSKALPYLKEEMQMVKGGDISYSQLADDWLSHSCHILEIPFQNSAYLSVLKEAQQFLWADHDMDPVRDMKIKLIEAQRWALDINSCVCKVESFMHCPQKYNERVSLDELERLLNFQPLPCYEAGFSKLKTLAEDAQSLVIEVQSALSAYLSIDKLEMLYNRTTEFPVSLQITERLYGEIASAKNWLNNAHLCLMEKKPGSIDIDFFNKLKSEELEDFLIVADNLIVSIPEMDLLRKYRSDACSWACHLQDVLQNLNERNDHGSIVIELSHILKAGELLRVQVDELPLVKAELKKSICRENALKALATPMPLSFSQQVLNEASQLEIENEKLFIDISEVLRRAVSWEERAKSALEHELVSQSELLKVTVDASEKLQSILKEVERWVQYACSLLEDAKSLFNMHHADLIVDNNFLTKIEELLSKVDSAIEDGQSLCFHFKELPELRNASLSLQWCLTALSFCYKVPLLKEVERLLEVADCLPIIFADSYLAEVLIVGVNCLRKALSILPEPHNFKRRKLKDVEIILDEIQKYIVPYPLIVSQIQNAIQKHESWLKQVNACFALPSEQLWPSLLELKEHGKAVAFECSELYKVASEVGKIENWMSECHVLLDAVVGDLDSLSAGLVQIKGSLDKALCVYRGSKGRRAREFSVCCPNYAGNEEGYTCLISRGNRPEMKSFCEFLSAAKDFRARFKELNLVEEIVKQALECKSNLTEIAIAVAGIYDHEDCSNLELALSKNSWKVRVKKLLRGSKKPVLQQIQRLIKEGIAMGIASEDHFMREIAEVRQISLRWADVAKKVISDSGELALSEVYKLISEGENLPLNLEKELKSLRARSLLYCICRKPYDQRAMIACDQCDEWYHFDCIDLREPPRKTFYCPACRPFLEEFISLPQAMRNEERSSNVGGPDTPPVCQRESKRRGSINFGSNLHQKLQDAVDLLEVLRFSDIDQLWRENKRPLHRTAKRHMKL
ncbi:JmjC domain, hydroxylase [Musa troglodytarum]|uniref:JmjC domain, hydroxylase n=1 Tax=Musa troglodytarum TaxID=320322 RepID=A0A9E7HB01_9LILI|nr:JmjC domain, hydroxylase [Musa troglodytarum]